MFHRPESPGYGDAHFAIALTRASDNEGLKPWRLAGATTPSTATGSDARRDKSSDCVLGVEVIEASDTYSGVQP